MKNNVMKIILIKLKLELLIEWIWTQGWVGDTRALQSAKLLKIFEARPSNHCAIGRGATRNLACELKLRFALGMWKSDWLRRELAKIGVPKSLIPIILSFFYPVRKLKTFRKLIFADSGIASLGSSFTAVISKVLFLRLK